MATSRSPPGWGRWACPFLSPHSDHMVQQTGPAAGKQKPQESRKVHPLSLKTWKASWTPCTHHCVDPPRRHLNSVYQSSLKVKAAKTPVLDPGTFRSSHGRSLWVSHRIFWNVSEHVREGGVTAQPHAGHRQWGVHTRCVSRAGGRPQLGI